MSNKTIIRDSLKSIKYHKGENKDGNEDCFTFSFENVDRNDIDRRDKLEKICDYGAKILLSYMGLSQLIALVFMPFNDLVALYVSLSGFLAVSILIIGGIVFDGLTGDFYPIDTSHWDKNLYSALMKLYEAGQIAEKKGSSSSYRTFIDNSEMEHPRKVVLKKLRSMNFITEEEYQKYVAIKANDGRSTKKTIFTPFTGKKVNPGFTKKGDTHSKDYFFDKDSAASGSIQDKPEANDVSIDSEALPIGLKSFLEGIFEKREASAAERSRKESIESTYNDLLYLIKMASRNGDFKISRSMANVPDEVIKRLEGRGYEVIVSNERYNKRVTVKW